MSERAAVGLRRLVARLRSLPVVVRARRSAQRWRLVPRPPTVCYLTRDFPAPPPRRAQFAWGGAVKTTYLSERFPHAYPGCNLLYTISSVHHPAAPLLVDRARQRGLRVVLNQNGVYYRAWFGPGWEIHNRPLASVHAQADYVIYQSEFCRDSAARFLGSRTGPQCVLPNPVDLAQYRPRDDTGRPGELVLLTAAVPRARAVRLRTAVATLGALGRMRPRVRLIVAGYDPGHHEDAEMIRAARTWAGAAGLSAEALDFVPRYTRLEAPAIFQRAHILLHPVYNDPAPNLVGEALACGLPVVYSDSGGVPELVGRDAGAGVTAPVDWEVYHAPDPQSLAEAVSRVADSLPLYAQAARARAEDVLSLPRYLECHASIFERLLSA